jgi:CDP-diacylglycerol--serine O-phosphatidyltransferase|tara:strand:+ start:135 stop:914 length:780 start_codon:yes stop_codon:yes gene_type:complete
MTTKQKDPIQKTPKLAIHKLVPNMMTIAALIAGMTSIQYAIDDRWERAVIAIVIAAFIDAFDGAAARLLNAQSRLGAELDSLSDFLCFGVAPATIMYLWLLHGAGKFGWMTALAFAIATALRLARFNAEDKMSMDDEDCPKKSSYFKGVPAPTAAGMALLPMIISFEYSDSGKILDFVTNTHYVAAWLILFAFLMVSHLPTFSSKHIRLHPTLVIPVLALFGLMIAGLLHATWITLMVMGAVYALSIPLALIMSLRAEK